MDLRVCLRVPGFVCRCGLMHMAGRAHMHFTWAKYIAKPPGPSADLSTWGGLVLIAGVALSFAIGNRSGASPLVGLRLSKKSLL